KAQAGILDNDDAEAAWAKLRDAVEAVAHTGRSDDAERSGWLAARLRPLAGARAVGEQPAPGGVVSARSPVLESIAASGPCVLVLEDMHWADPAMVAFCQHLLEWVSGVPLLLLVTARPELYDVVPAWGTGHRNATTIGLSPLTSSETAQLVAGM